MLGYMTPRKAKEHGFTHYGWYYFMPVYMTYEECPMVEPRHLLLAPVMALMTVLEGLFNWIRGNEAAFMFEIGEEI